MVQDLLSNRHRRHRWDGRDHGRGNRRSLLVPLEPHGVESHGAPCNASHFLPLQNPDDPARCAVSRRRRRIHGPRPPTTIAATSKLRPRPLICSEARKYSTEPGNSMLTPPTTIALGKTPVQPVTRVTPKRGPLESRHETARNDNCRNPLLESPRHAEHLLPNRRLTNSGCPSAKHLKKKHPSATGSTTWLFGPLPLRDSCRSVSRGISIPQL